MTAALAILAVLLAAIVIVVLTAASSDAKDIQDEEAAAVETETPEERREFLKHSDEVPASISTEFSKADPETADTSDTD